MLNEICELIVSRGGYRMAWVGLALHDSERTVQLVARAGVFDGYLDGVCLSWGDNEIGRGPSGTAIRTGQTQVTQDFSCNAQMRPWRVAALARGYQSNIALVLKSNTECYGALTIYADEPGVFTAQEVALLEEVAQDLGYCMMALRTRAEHRQAEAALAASEERYRSLFEHMVEGFAYCQMLYEDGRPVDFVYLNVNNAFERLSGLGPVEGKKISDVIPDLRFTTPELFEIYGRVAKSGEPERFEIYLERLKAWFTISVYSNQVGYFIAIFDNITERKESEARIRIWRITMP